MVALVIPFLIDIPSNLGLPTEEKCLNTGRAMWLSRTDFTVHAGYVFMCILPAEPPFFKTSGSPYLIYLYICFYLVFFSHYLVNNVDYDDDVVNERRLRLLCIFKIMANIFLSFLYLLFKLNWLYFSLLDLTWIARCQAGWLAGLLWFGFLSCSLTDLTS